MAVHDERDAEQAISSSAGLPPVAAAAAVMRERGGEEALERPVGRAVRLGAGDVCEFGVGAWHCPSTPEAGDQYGMLTRVWEGIDRIEIGVAGEGGEMSVDDRARGDGGYDW
jgi:hypothetical protein